MVQLRAVDALTGIDPSELIRVSPGGRKEPNLLEVDDILFANRGMHLFGALVDHEIEGALAAPHFFILRATSPAVFPGYLVWYLNNKRAQRYYHTCAAGTALPHITRKALEALPVLLPPLETQRRVVAAYRCWQKERRITEELLSLREKYITHVLDEAISN